MLSAKEGKLRLKVNLFRVDKDRMSHTVYDGSLFIGPSQLHLVMVLKLLI